MPILEYKQWRQFNDAVKKAKGLCKASNNAVLDHFADVRKMVKAGVVK